MGQQCGQCEAQGKITHLEDDGSNFSVRGRVHFVYAFDLSKLIEDADVDVFERLRGKDSLGEAFKAACGNAPPSFTLNEIEQATVDEGHRIAAFRTRFRNGWLFNTYHPADAAEPPRDQRLGKVWDEYYCYVRFSRLGLLEVKLTRQIPLGADLDIKCRQDLIAAMNDLLDIRVSGASADTESHMAYYIAARFAKEISQICVQEKDSPTVVIRFKTDLPEWPEKSEDRNRVFERYTVLVLEDIECAVCGRRFGAKELWTKSKSVIGAILEGNLLEAKRLTLPVIDTENTRHLRDLGSWANDLCLFAHERALFYYPDLKMRIAPFRTGSAGNESIPYQRYWNCIIRIIEHAVSMRAALHVLEARTTLALSSISYLMQNVIADGKMTESEQEKIQALANEMSKNFSLLPFVRDALVPTSSFRGSYAANKFDYLTQDVFHLDEILLHIQRNMDEAFEFVQYFKSMQLQNAAERARQQVEEQERLAGIERMRDDMRARMATYAGAAIAILAVFAVAPSFILDFFDLIHSKLCMRYIIPVACDRPLVIAAICYVIIIASGFAAAIVLFLRYRRRDARLRAEMGPRKTSDAQ